MQQFALRNGIISQKSRSGARMIDMGRPKTINPTETVRLYSSLVRMARMIAAYEDRELSDVLSELVDAPLKKRYADMLKKLTEEKKQ